MIGLTKEMLTRAWSRFHMVFMLMIADTAGQIYNLSYVKSDSKGAHNLCTLAAPPLLEDGVRINLTAEDLGEKKIDHFKLWVGYVETLADFLYIGCSRSIPNDKIQLQTSDIGRCYSICNTSFIGMSGHDCFCLKSLPLKYSSDECDTVCKRPRNTLCGKAERGENKAISIYRKEDFIGTLNDDTGGMCLTRTIGGHNYKWEKCGTRHNFLCQSGSIDQNFTTFTPGKNMKIWRNGMRVCFKHELYPSHYKQENLHFKTDTYWIGGIRSLVSYNSSDSVDEAGFKQGYIEYNSGSFELHFQETVHDDTQLNGLCLKTFDTSDQRSKESSNNDTSDQRSKESSKIVVVYVIVSILLLIGMTVSAAVFIKRKRSLVEGRGNKNDVCRIGADTAYNTRTISENRINDETARSHINDNCIILESARDCVDGKDNATDEYDTTQHFIKTFNQSDNAYDKLEVEVYDRANSLGNKILQHDNTYSNANIKFNNKQEEEEDTYHHTNTLGIRTIQTDSIYHKAEMNTMINNEDNIYDNSDTL